MSDSAWISVNYRLPEKLQTVLLYFDKPVVAPRCVTGFVGNDGYWWLTSAPESLGAHSPDYWQPLPEPPAKKSSFDEWWESLPVNGNSDRYRCIAGRITSKEEARVTWDAAAKAAMGPNYTP